MAVGVGGGSAAGGSARRSPESGAARMLERLLPSISAWAHGRLPGRARGRVETADLVQDATVGALRHLPPDKLDRAGTVRSYILESIRNRIVDEIRRAEMVEGHLPEAKRGARDPAASPLDQAIETEDRRLYRRGLLALDDDERLLVVGRVDFELGYRELALATGRGSEAVTRAAAKRAIIHLAREVGRLRRLPRA